MKYTQRTMNVFCVQYNNTFRILIGLPRFCGISAIAKAYTYGFYVILHKETPFLMHRARGSFAKVLSDRYNCRIRNRWVKLLAEFKALSPAKFFLILLRSCCLRLQTQNFLHVIIAFTHIA